MAPGFLSHPALLVRIVLRLRKRRRGQTSMTQARQKETREREKEKEREKSLCLPSNTLGRRTCSFDTQTDPMPLFPLVLLTHKHLPGFFSLFLSFFRWNEENMANATGQPLVEKPFTCALCSFIRINQSMFKNTLLSLTIV